MVKKLQKMAEKKAAAPTGLLDSQLAQTIKDSAQQIWLAGLGAFAKAQGEGGKVFDTLIKEGVNLQRKTQAAGEKLGDVAGKMTAMAGEVGSKANAQWDKLETIFEERTARALGRLGLPSAKELAALVDRVAALEKAAGIASPAAEPETRPAARPRRRAAKPAAAEAAAPARPAARKAARKAAGAAAVAAEAAADTAAAAKAPIRRRRAA
ncbi:MAG: phasin family protein [Burkholderiaceae bacterium]|nr:phasin family protein [Burkholderiaceae bacterium]